MALPLILSMLGSGLAGAGALSGLGILASPLVAGAIGSGLGTAIETGDLGEGIKAGLTAGALGGIGGALVGGGAGVLGPQAGQTAGNLTGDVVGQAGAQTGLRGLMQRMPTGFAGPTEETAFGTFMANRGTDAATAFPFGDVMRQGLNQGVLTGAGIGTAIPGALRAMTPTMPEPEEYTPTYGPAVPFERNAVAAPEDYIPGVSGEHLYFDRYSVPTPARLAEGGQVSSLDRFINRNADDFGRAPMGIELLMRAVDDFPTTGVNPFTAIRQMAAGNYKSPSAAAPATPAMQTQYTPPPAGYQPGVDPEWVYSRMVPKVAGGGMLRYTPAGMSEPMRMQAGGIADMMPGAEREAPPMNDKDIVAESIRAIKGELPEQEAAIVLGQFLQTYGEEALRKLVDDVQSGRADQAGGDMEGTIRGPGDGMDDMVPAAMDDGSQDVLLSDGEFIVPADVVSGLGNGSTDAGAKELHRMMDRVRQERTGRTEQAKQIRAGGLMPA